MKQIYVIFLLILLLTAVPEKTYAQPPSAAYVTITVMGYIAESPTGLVITYINDNESFVNWTKGSDSVSTMIRIKYGQPIIDITDGDEIYQGPGNITIHWVNNIGLELVYYKRWAQKLDGSWEELPLTTSYINDDEVLLSWINGIDFIQTVIKAMYGREVADITDGYTVYTGTDNNTLIKVVYNTGIDPVYYRAWSQRIDGVWEQVGSANVEANFMSLSFMYLGVILLIIALMVMCFIFKYTWLFFMTAFLWFGVGIQQLLTYYAGGAQATTLSMTVGYVGIGMTVAMFTASFFVNPREEKPEKLSDIDQYAKDADDYNNQINKYRSLGKRRKK